MEKMIEEPVGWGRKITHAVWLLVLNLILWVAIPVVIFSLLAQRLPSLPLAYDPGFVYAFGATITGLQVLGALAEGHAIRVPIVSGSYLASAYFIWAITWGGDLSVTSSGLQITLFFQPLVFLLMLPSLFSAVRDPLTYLLEQTEVARLSSDAV